MKQQSSARTHIVYFFQICLMAGLLIPGTILAQFSGHVTVIESGLANRSWHITNGLNDRFIGAANGDVGEVNNYNTNNPNTWIFDDAVHDGRWWTPDRRYFGIRNTATGEYLTLEGDTGGAGTTLAPLIDPDSDLSHRQQFEIVPAPALSGWYRLKSRVGPYILEVRDNGQIHLASAPVNASPRQKFGFNLAKPNDSQRIYVLLNKAKTTFLTDEGISERPFWPTDISDDATGVFNKEDASFASYWHFEPDGNGFYHIRNDLTERYLRQKNDDFEAVRTPDGAFPLNYKWTLERNETSFELVNAANFPGIGNRLGAAFGHGENGERTVPRTNTELNIRWYILDLPPVDEPQATGNFDRILDGADEVDTCLPSPNPGTRLALSERINMTDGDYYDFLFAAARNYYGGDSQTALRAFQNINLFNPGHTAELRFMWRQYLIEVLGRKNEPSLTDDERALIAMLETRVEVIREDYAQRLEAAWTEFNLVVDFTNGAPNTSDLFNDLDVADFNWPRDYRPLSDGEQQRALDDFSANVQFGNRTSGEIGTHVGTTALSAAGGLAFLAAAFVKVIPNTAISMTMTAPLGIASAVLLSIEIIALESEQAAELIRFERKYNRILADSRRSANFFVLGGSDELKKLKLISDIDQIILRSPLTYQYQHDGFIGPLGCGSFPTLTDVSFSGDCTPGTDVIISIDGVLRDADRWELRRVAGNTLEVIATTTGNTFTVKPTEATTYEVASAGGNVPHPTQRITVYRDGALNIGPEYFFGNENGVARVALLNDDLPDNATVEFGVPQGPGVSIRFVGTQTIEISGQPGQAYIFTAFVNNPEDLDCTYAATSTTVVMPTARRVPTGDLMFIGYNSAPTTSYSLAVLEDIPAGTVVAFTNNGWGTTGGFRSGEQAISYRTVRPESCGDRWFIYGDGESIRDENGETVALKTGGAPLQLSTLGDQIFALKIGLGENSIAPDIICAIQMNCQASGCSEENWDGDATGPHTSARPNTLGFGSYSFFGGIVEADNARVTCGLEATCADGLRSQLTDPTNWEMRDGVRFVLAETCAVVCDDANIGTPGEVTNFTDIVPGTCPGQTYPVSITGNLNDSDRWEWQREVAGGQRIVIGYGSTINVEPGPGPSLTRLFVRAVGGTACEAGIQESIIMEPETVPPTVVPVTNPSFALDEQGTVTISPDDLIDFSLSFDNCTPPPGILPEPSVFGVSVTPSTFTSADLGENDVLLIARDANGNETEVMVTVMITEFVLPVEWLSFTATPEKESVKLAWSTTSEADNAGFIVERSAEGVQWDMIGEVTPHPGTAEVEDYTWTDEAPLAGTSYYRIVQFDFGGERTYSPVRSVTFVGEPSLELFPNPTFGSVTVRLPETVGEHWRLTLLSPLGQVIPITEDRPFAAGEIILRFPYLPPGAYYLTARLDNGTSLTNRLIIWR